MKFISLSFRIDVLYDDKIYCEFIIEHVFEQYRFLILMYGIIWHHWKLLCSYICTSLTHNVIYSINQLICPWILVLFSTQSLCACCWIKTIILFKENVHRQVFKIGVWNFVTRRAKLLQTYSMLNKACGNEAVAHKQHCEWYKHFKS